MSELTDDQLDGLFRKSAEEFDPPVEPGAWPAMKSLLDEHDRGAPPPPALWKKLSRWGLFVLALLLLTGGGWYAYRNKKSASTPPPASIHLPATDPLSDADGKIAQPVTRQSANQPDKADKRTVSAVKSPVEPTVDSSTDRAFFTRRSEHIARKFASKSPTADRVDSTGRATRPAANAYRQTNRATDERRETAAATLSVRGTGPVVRSAREGRKPFRLTTTRITARRRSTDLNRDLTFSNSSYATSINSSLTSRRGAGTTYPPITTDPMRTNEPSREWMILSAPGRLKSRPVNLPDSLSRIRQSVEAQPVVSVSPKAGLSNEKGLSIRVVVSPDLSTIGLRNFSRPGTNVGLLAEYRLAKRWSVQAGVIQSMKVYRALPSDYQVPAGTWPSSLKAPEYIDGNCNVIDIPINVRYDIAVQPRVNDRPASRWFISGGVTNYVMKREDYAFVYPTWTYDPVPVSTGAYGLSTLNVSAGYERAFGRRFFWQVEPFLKMPLRGVGAYKINLLSTGVFFSIRYKL